MKLAQMVKMAQRIAIVLFIVVCTLWQAHAAVTCTAAGRFADTSDTTCQNYTLCVYDNSTSSYLAYNYQCPTTSVFSPALSQCTASSNYVCNNTADNSTSTDCTSDGYIADPSSTNCSSYIECVEIDGSYTETTYSCPSNTYYDPDTTYCESDYNCTSSFSCTAVGRFADTDDSTCQSYYYCVYDSSTSSYLQYNYTCPSTSLFSPSLSMCTSSYTCTN